MEGCSLPYSCFTLKLASLISKNKIDDITNSGHTIDNIIKSYCEADSCHWVFIIMVNFQVNLVENTHRYSDHKQRLE